MTGGIGERRERERGVATVALIFRAVAGLWHHAPKGGDSDRRESQKEGSLTTLVGHPLIIHLLVCFDLLLLHTKVFTVSIFF